VVVEGTFLRYAGKDVWASPERVSHEGEFGQ
jgi:hypothetical protein